MNQTLVPQKHTAEKNNATVDIFAQISYFPVTTAMQLNPVIHRMVLHWGEMGARWGISRTVAQIHALLYFSPKPLTADEIVEALGVARSHVSNSLKELQSWGVVKGTCVLGDRREHFESIKDVWQMFEILLDERKRREMDPTLKALRETSAQLDAATPVDPHTKKRLQEMLEFFETMDGWFGEVRRLPLAARIKLATLGARLGKWLK
jgi:DNA-binding transcriptional regulator GbsR (MarR family)